MTCMGPCHPVTSDGRTDSEDFSFSPLCIDMVYRSASNATVEAAKAISVASNLVIEVRNLSC
ncbi:hypothetical protein Pint_09691 [Pistacia integerrima]|uniref:Uncharacterized protein n=1 Tax=Pistacia integerrima TaxID=434235 RepID=A0ACC0XE22_9ROSI|nr:hypothetical protein Pint_09691 [Pistacia integerrima]